jgi:hypothetical protein
LTDENNWKETIINCDCCGSDTYPCKNKWCFINDDDIEKYKRQTIPTGNDSRIQKSLGLFEINPSINDLIVNNWIHENGKYIMSEKAYKIQKYIEYKPIKEITKYKIMNDFCSKHNYYDIKLINVNQLKIINRCNHCKDFIKEDIFNDEMRHQPLKYKSCFNIIKKCNCEIIETIHDVCLFCNEDEDNIFVSLTKEKHEIFIPKINIKKTNKMCDLHINIYLYSFTSIHSNNCCYYDNINFNKLKKDILNIYDDKLLNKYNECNLLKLKDCNCSYKNKIYKCCPICDTEIFISNQKLNDKLKFGKYIECNIIDIIKTDLNYINWIYTNVNDYKKILDKIIKF